ncbi:MAG: FAD binding domain-containing protein, partial [Planctomycetota bacterium]
MLRLPSFRYLRPRTVEEAVKWRADAGPEGAFVAGGTDLYPNMKRRQQTPATVIGLSAVPELSALSGDPAKGVTLGATTTLTRVCEDPFLREHYREVADAARTISTPLLRNMGTIGGNVLLDTRCNYYDQTYEWRKSIDFCMKKEGTICWVAPSSPRCWAVQSSDLVPMLCAIGA